MQVVQFGLQRQKPSAQYPVQQAESFLHVLSRFEPLPQGPAALGPVSLSLRRLPFFADAAVAPPIRAPSAAETPARRVVAVPSAREIRSNWLPSI